MEVFSVLDGDPRLKDPKYKEIQIGFLMNVPRLGWTDHFSSLANAVYSFRWPVVKTSGAYWAQSMEWGMEAVVRAGINWCICVDYDSIFTCEHIAALLDLAAAHPEADAICCNQVRRESPNPLVTMDHEGKFILEPTKDMFKGELTEIVTGHFGLTLLKLNQIFGPPKAVGHPWFYCKPGNETHQWDQGRVDADIWWWLQLKEAGKRCFQANEIRIGHLQLVVTWYDPNFELVHQYVTEYDRNGVPRNVCGDNKKLLKEKAHRQKESQIFNPCGIQVNGQPIGDAKIESATQK